MSLNCALCVYTFHQLRNSCIASQSLHMPLLQDNLAVLHIAVLFSEVTIK